MNESPASDHGDELSGLSYPDALIMAKAEIYGAAIERGDYESQGIIEEKVAVRARQIMSARDTRSVPHSWRAISCVVEWAA